MIAYTPFTPFPDKNLDLTYNRVCWHVYLTASCATSLCHTFIHCTKFSTAASILSLPPCFSGSVASQLRIFGMIIPLPNTIPAYQLAIFAHIWPIAFCV